MVSRTPKAAVVEEFRVRTIQSAALRVISRKGLAGASMQEIAREAGVAKGTLYLYFEDRDDLVRRTADQAFAEFIERLDAALAPARTLRARLEALVRSKLAYFHEHREFFRLYFALGHSRRSGDPAGCPGGGKHYEAYVERVRTALCASAVRTADAERLAAFLTDGVNAIVFRRLMEEAPPPAEADALRIVETLLHGLPRRRGDS